MLLNRPFRSLLLIALFSMGFSCSAHALFSKTISLSQQELQQQLDQMGSAQYQDALLSVLVKDPKVELSPGSDKIGLRGKVETVLLGTLQASALLHLRGSVIYKAKEGAFYLQNIELLSLESDQIPPKQLANVQSIVENLLNQLLEEQPIYELNEAEHTEQLAKAVLKNVSVENAKVLLHLSAF